MPEKTYGQLCPISRACEILQPRWTILIISELWSGSTRFNDIRRGVGNISPGLLSRRLKELETAGLIERVEDRATGTVDYFRTEKAVALEPALNALAEWAQCHIDAEIALSGTDVSTLMWKMRRWIETSGLPPGRSVIRIHFDDRNCDYNTYWLLLEAGILPEICTSDPGLDVDLYIETSVLSLGGIMMGRTNIERETANGRLFLSGDPRLARLERWLPLSPYIELEGIPQLPDPPRI